MFSGYDDGYWKAMIDVLNMLEKADDDWLKSKKKYKLWVTTWLKLLASNGTIRYWFRVFGGDTAQIPYDLLWNDEKGVYAETEKFGND